MIHKVGDLVRFKIMEYILDGYSLTEQIGLIKEVKTYPSSMVCYRVLYKDKEHWIQNMDILEVL